ncbi:GNAT family N-acetyltransferase [Paenibacillus beijingensis]|uniref:N-acetyltransferase domain-containing protein n=1 Tax=Paenibacillus beijingensis TaxID=1126833 RepID=A0A0D5NR09_9BACL|nr:GNAT family N-acetyltransferase [Paenibacillus beijingensis]AJY77348.1 hypothetical protein VN24_25790 [Paenibacillus beijingensis]
MMFTFRDAHREDFQLISTFPQNQMEAYFMFPRGGYPLHPEQLFEIAQNRLLPTVIERNNKIVGYCNIYDRTEGESCWLGNVIINPEFRGIGAGKHLIRVIKARAKEEIKVNEINLVCHNINTKALLFYYKLGFKPFDLKIMKDFNDNEIAGIMMKSKL